MSQEILTNLQSEIDRRQKNIEAARTALEAAQTEYDSFVAQITTSLKLPARVGGQTSETVYSH